MSQQTAAEVRHTEHEITVDAPADTVYRLIHAATDWPAVFPPTVHVEELERDESHERLRIWATANGEVKNWTSRRDFDPEARRIDFRQEKSSAPVASMGGAWIVEPLSGTRTRVRLLHDYTAVDDAPDAVSWIAQAVDRNSGAELRALKEAAELRAADELVFSFEDTVRIRGRAEDVYDFLNEAQLWEERLPHVSRVELTEDTPGVQVLEMDTRAKDGSSHTTKSIRLCTPHTTIRYKQIVLPALLAAHTGVWTVEPLSGPEGGVAVTSQHTVVIRPDAIEGVMGEGAGIVQAQEFVRSALSTNSRATLALTKEFAENAAGDARRETALPEHLDAERYQQIQQFYARQMQMLDDGDGHGWAQTFTEDGVFAQNVKPDPWKGRDQIGARMSAGLARVAERGLTRRHWFGMVAAAPAENGTVKTRYYATVYETPKGGKASLYLSTLGEDVLVQQDGHWLVRHRWVAHDGAA
ncbi:SRPBCC family protein [Streptomyces sp. NPDC050759]|uniref:SRPBCC family protein n=1 Tax=Streptomyces sp. NPDC050759 TaxID=3365635 RepID=UPI0037A4AE09